MMMQNSKKANSKFYLLMIIFLLPMIGSWLLYAFHDHFQLKTKNHGVLINPPLQAQNIWQHAANRTWQIVYIPENCQNDRCEKMLFTLSQMRKLLGKDYQRVSITLVTNHAYQSKREYHVHNEIFSQQQTDHFLQAMTKNNSSFIATNKIYLIDPIGNLFMYYASDANPMDVLKDIKHLLGVSQIG